MTWLVIISWVAIFIGILQAIIITVDVARHPQQMMPIMNIVWPLTGLYFPIFGIWAYDRLGKAKKQSEHTHIEHMNTESGKDMGMNDEGNDDHHDGNHHEHEGMHHHSHGNKPFWQSVFVSTTHCSSGCSLGDMIGAPIVFFTGLTIASITLYADFVVEFIIAYIFGIGFQYYGMGFTKHDQPGQAIKNAIKADTWSLVAFEIGMFGWMALAYFLFFVNMPEPNTPVYWFMMQIGMMIGFCTSYPANWVLVKKGVKHAM